MFIYGNYCLSSEQRYRSNSANLGLELVSESFSRKCFMQYGSCFICSITESENNSNKMAEVDPIYDTLNIAFIQYGIFHTFLSEDKSVVTYYGRNSSFVANQFFLGIKFDVSTRCFDVSKTISCNWTRTHSHLVHKRLWTKWLWVRVQLQSL